jgi:hypothetical protein
VASRAAGIGLISTTTRRASSAGLGTISAAKLELRDRVHAVVFAFESGLVRPGS